MILAHQDRLHLALFVPHRFPSLDPDFSPKNSVESDYLL